MSTYAAGLLVRHPRCPDWGVGKVVSVAGPNVSVFFRGAGGTTNAEVIKTINVVRLELEVLTDQSDPWLDNLALDRRGMVAVSSKRVSVDELVARFLAVHPLGFADPALERSRSAALVAVETYRSTLGGDPESLSGTGALEEAFSRTLSAAEAAALLPAAEAAVLRGELASRESAKPVLSALRRLMRSERGDRRSFESLVDALPVTAPQGSKGRSPWPAATVLPFLARPDTFGILHADETRAVADMLTFRLRFLPEANWSTYADFLKLGQALQADLTARDLEPRDWSDLQAFIGCVGAKPVRAKPVPRSRAAKRETTS